MVGTKKAKETEKKMMMKIKKAATSKSHGSRPTVRKYCWPSAALRLLTRSHSGPHFTALVAAIPGGPATVPCGEGSSRITIVDQIFDSIQYGVQC
jgi:hypothetical protein